MGGAHVQKHHDEDRPPQPLPRGRRRLLLRRDGVERPLVRHHARSGGVGELGAWGSPIGGNCAMGSGTFGRELGLPIY
jgi:hypothetical protein